MQSFSCEKMKLEGLKIIKPFYVEDERGYLLKSFEKDIFKQFGLANEIHEDFISYSKKDILRGMHFQTKEPQTKLVQCILGHILDVVVDLRKDSTTFGLWEALELSDQNMKCMYIPKGFAHGYLVLSEQAIVSYKCTGKYLPEFDTGIVWNDARLNIAWNAKDPIVSDRDRQLMTFNMFIEHIGGL